MTATSTCINWFKITEVLWAKIIWLKWKDAAFVLYVQICNHHTDPGSDTTPCNHSNLNYSSMMLGKGKEILQENVVSLIKIHANIITCRWSWYWKYRWCILFLTWLFVLLKKVFFMVQFFLSGVSAYLSSFRPPFQSTGSKWWNIWKCS